MGLLSISWELARKAGSRAPNRPAQSPQNGICALTSPPRNTQIPEGWVGKADSDAAGLGKDPRVCISNKLPGAAEAAHLRPRFEHQAPRREATRPTSG